MSGAGSDDASSDELDERTVRTGRAGAEAPDDSTVVVSGRRPASESDGVRSAEAGAAVGADREADDVAGFDAEFDADDTVLVSRSVDPGGGAPDPAPGPRRRPPADDEGETAGPEDGSTMVVRRETRRRAARSAEASVDDRPAAPATADGAAAADARAARAPEPTSAVYAPRRGEPTIAARTPLGPRPRQEVVDSAAVDATTRARARRRILLAVAAASVVLAVAVVTLVLLTTLG